MTTSEYCAPRVRPEGRLNIFDNGPCAMQPVFRDYDQKALDDAYDQAVYAPNRDQLLERRNRASEAARRRLGEPQRFAYGAGANEQLDVYPTRRGTHIQVFVHGGAWRAGRAREYAAPAEMFAGAGVHYVALDFDNAPDCEGDLFVMADQVRRAIAWVYRNAALFGGDAERIYVSGTSSGAHLAGVAATTDWERFGMPAEPGEGLRAVQRNVRPARAAPVQAQRVHSLQRRAWRPSYRRSGMSSASARRSCCSTARSRPPSSSARHGNSPPRSSARRRR